MQIDSNKFFSRVGWDEVLEVFGTPLKAKGNISLFVESFSGLSGIRDLSEYVQLYHVL